MGTRSLTRVFDTFVGEGRKPEQVLCMYRQMDGYPSGHGKELAEFLTGRAITNGIGEHNTANGAGCLAAQIVAHFKGPSLDPGGIYLMAPSTKDAGQDYEYHVIAGPETGIKVEVREPTHNKKYDITGTKLIFTGDVAQFTKFCAKDTG